MTGPAPQPAPRRVLLIDLDDWGRENFNATKTPRLWAHAAAGLRFLNFWGRPLCSPFRAAVLTGCESIRPQNYVGENVLPTLGFAGPSGPWYTLGMPGTKTKRGKWHLSGTPQSLPDQWPLAVVGFGKFDAYSGSHANLSHHGSSYYLWERGWATAAGHGVATCTTFATNDTAGDTASDLSAGVEFVHASFNAVHKPVLAAPPQDEPPGTTYTEGGADNYLLHADYRIGLLIDQAVAAGYLVIVCGDNGTSGQGKGDYTEAGLNTPCFAVGAGVPVAVTDRLVQCTDLAATVSELRGGTFHAQDSRSFADLFGFTGSPARAALTASGYAGLGQAPAAGSVTRAARDLRYKLLDDQGVLSFFDLQADPSEAAPITPTTQREVAAYQALLAALPA